MRTARSSALAAAVAVLALFAPAAPAVAGIWTPVASGTTADITAVDDVNQDVMLYGTASGQLLRNGTVTSANPGHVINDIALSPWDETHPSIPVGLAVGSGGLLLRSTSQGNSWSPVTLPMTYDQPVPCASTGPASHTITGDLNAVAWASPTVAYVATSERGIVLKTSDRGATWSDASRRLDGTCRVDPRAGNVLTDVAAVADTDVAWFVDNGFGATSVTTDALASPAPRRDTGAVNCSGRRPQLALDADNPNRAVMVDRCDGAQQLATTTDGGATWQTPSYRAGDGTALRGLNDVAIKYSSALVVGNAGAILIVNDPRTAYFQPADGALATTDWLAVSQGQGAHAIVGGAGGALIQTDTAGTIPDLVAPGGTVIGPATATVGVPVTLGLVAGDNPGGTGLDPAATVWSAPGAPAPALRPNGIGGEATYTFPAPGAYPVTATYQDHAGNRAGATLTVTVSTAPGPPIKSVPPKATAKTRITTASVAGAKLSLGVPNTCVAPGKTFKVTLSWKKQKRKGNRFVKVRRADFYIGAKRVKIDKKAPFTQTLTVKAGTRPGSKITVKARAYIKVSKGKSPTKSIKAGVKVC